MSPARTTRWFRTWLACPSTTPRPRSPPRGSSSTTRSRPCPTPPRPIRSHARIPLTGRVPCRAARATSSSPQEAQPAVAERRLAGAVVALGAVATGGLVYSTVLERSWFALRRLQVPVLQPGAWPIRLLHLSDLHITPGHRHKAAWVGALADLRPDFVINTGDTLSDADAVPMAVTAFGALLDLPGAFVFGNNDYYAPRMKSPHRYFTDSPPLPKTAPLPWRDLGAAQSARGWIDLSNRKQVVT